jgi:hypothetical protein
MRIIIITFHFFGGPLRKALQLYLMSKGMNGGEERKVHGPGASDVVVSLVLCWRGVAWAVLSPAASGLCCQKMLFQSTLYPARLPFISKFPGETTAAAKVSLEGYVVQQPVLAVAW